MFSRSIQINKGFVGHELGSQPCPARKGLCLLNLHSLQKIVISYGREEFKIIT